MKHFLKSVIIAASIVSTSSIADVVKIDAVTLAPKPVYINKPFKAFVEEVNSKQLEQILTITKQKLGNLIFISISLETNKSCHWLVKLMQQKNLQ